MTKKNKLILQKKLYIYSSIKQNKHLNDNYTIGKTRFSIQCTHTKLRTKDKIRKTPTEQATQPSINHISKICNVSEINKKINTSLHYKINLKLT